MDKILNNLGLCQRAGALVSGLETVCEKMGSGECFYVFLASDSSEGSKKKIKNKAFYYHVEVNEEYSSSMLSAAIGKENRMVLGVTEKSFLKILKK